jgi:hypothetical protein
MKERERAREKGKESRGAAVVERREGKSRAENEKQSNKKESSNVFL